MADRSQWSEAQGHSQRDTASEGLSFLALSNILLKRRHGIIALAVGFAIIQAVILLVTPRTYTVESSFLVQNRDQNAAANLAAQFGVDVAGVDPSQSPVLYSDLLKTPDVLRHLVDTTFQISTSTKAQSLAEIWQISERDNVLRRDAALKRLEKAISSSVGLKVEVIAVQVVTNDPVLSVGISKALLAELNRFNLVTRQSRAAAERRFTERRLQEIGAELRQAEDQVQDFFQDNRQSGLSIGLDLQKQRLARKVDLLQQTYATLATANERARIDEVRDTPVITIVREPTMPVRPDPRGVVSKSIVMFLLGLMLGVAIAIGTTAMRVIRSSEKGEAREFVQLLADTSADVRRLRRALPGLSRGLGDDPPASR